MTAQPTIASAIQIGNPVSVDKAIRTLQRFDGIVEQATESELADAAARADRTGMFNCPHTGVALAALEKLVARGEVAKHRSGDRHLDRQRAEVHASSRSRTTRPASPGVPSRYANPPVELPNDYDAVRRAVDSVVSAESIASRGR